MALAFAAIPVAAADPRPATPKGNFGDWISQADVEEAIDKGWNGTVAFVLIISPDGRVNDCKVRQSSGHEALDQRTCQLLIERARFRPAINAEGNKTLGSYANRVNWGLPRR